MYPAIFWKYKQVLLLLTRVTFQRRWADFRDDTALLKCVTHPKWKPQSRAACWKCHQTEAGVQQVFTDPVRSKTATICSIRFFFNFFFAAAPFNRAEPQPAEEEMKLNRVSDGNPSSQHIYFVSTEQSICGECAVSVCEWILTPVSCRWRKKMWIQRMTEDIYIFFLSCDLRDWSNSK